MGNALCSVYFYGAQPMGSFIEETAQSPFLFPCLLLFESKKSITTPGEGGIELARNDTAGTAAAGHK
jgi:hypothetical protein